MTRSQIVAPGPTDQLVRLPDGRIVPPPPGWDLLPPGDAVLTRRVKAAGPTWTVQVRRGRKLFSHGVWAPAENVAAAREQVGAQRSTDSYQKRRESERKRRDAKQEVYAGEFQRAVLRFLDFAHPYAELAEAIARRVTDHAVPIGSGTVARTERIPIAERAEAAVIAWMRHHTTAYDRLRIERVKGRRREVRRMLAERSRDLLDAYRRGHEVEHSICPLYRAVADEPKGGAANAPATPPASGSDRSAPTPPRSADG